MASINIQEIALAQPLSSGVASRIIQLIGTFRLLNTSAIEEVQSTLINALSMRKRSSKYPPIKATRDSKMIKSQPVTILVGDESGKKVEKVVHMKKVKRRIVVSRGIMAGVMNLPISPDNANPSQAVA